MKKIDYMVGCRCYVHHFFLALLFLQVRYMRTSMDIRTKQFDEQVNRSLYNVMRDLEQDQTRDYLEQDMIESETDIHSIPPPRRCPPQIFQSRNRCSNNTTRRK